MLTGRQICGARELLGWSRNELARVVGVTTPAHAEAIDGASVSRAALRPALATADAEMDRVNGPAPQDGP